MVLKLRCAIKTVMDSPEIRDGFEKNWRSALRQIAEQFGSLQANEKLWDEIQDRAETPRKRCAWRGGRAQLGMPHHKLTLPLKERGQSAS